jgi:hypothetical protein
MIGWGSYVRSIVSGFRSPFEYGVDVLGRAVIAMAAVRRGKCDAREKSLT